MTVLNTSIRLHQTDAAGRLYFANLFNIAHDAWEEFLKDIGHDLPSILDGPVSLPIVHAEADFSRQLTLGDEVTVRAAVERIGSTSFTMAFSIADAEGRIAGGVKCVHVVVDKVSIKKMPIPEHFRLELEKHLKAL